MYNALAMPESKLFIVPREPARHQQTPNNLPVHPTRLVGREQEIEAVRRLLEEPEVRLLTLVGPGGVGKTRLALEVASGLLMRFPDGVYLVDLAAILDPDLVVPTVAATLGVREAASTPLLARLKEYLGERQMMLVLDNFEQVMLAASAVGELLTSCLYLKFLVTSRFALRLRAEREFAVDPLALPEAGSHPVVERLSQYSSVALFVQRARAVKPDFELTESNVNAVAEVCRRVDGLPLGIELVAGYAGLLPPQAMLARMKNPLHLLTGGTADTPDRHQTMRDTIEWSYRLLGELEQRLFRRISVFHGSFTLRAAEAVCNTAGDIDIQPEDPAAMEVMKGLKALLDKNLVSRFGARQVESDTAPADPADEDPRLTMLETVKEYAWEQLVASGEESDLRRRHADYYLHSAQAETTVGQIVSDAWAARLNRLSLDQDNFRAVLGLQIEQARPGTSEDALLLLMTLQDLWRRHAHLAEYSKWMARALAQVGPEPTRLRVEALVEMSDIAQRQGHYPEAKEWAKKAIVMAGELVDRRQLAEALMALASVEALLSEYDSARFWMEECLHVHRELGDDAAIARTLNNLGEVARYQGDLKRAEDLYKESLHIFRAMGAKIGIMLTRSNLGHVARHLGDLDEARTAYLEAISLAQETGVAPVAAQALTGLAGVILDEALRESQPEPAGGEHGKVSGRSSTAAEPPAAFEQVARLCGVVSGLLERSGRRLVPLEQADFDRSVAAARARLSEEGFAAAWEEGRAVDLGRIVELANLPSQQESRQAQRRGSGRQPSGGLTSRENEVAGLVAMGKTNREIARQLVLSRRTVEMHVANALQKLGLHTRTELAAWAISQGLAPEPS